MATQASVARTASLLYASVLMQLPEVFIVQCKLRPLTLGCYKENRICLPRNLMLERPFGAPLVTKDGFTVANEISIPDALQNIGAQMVRAVAENTAEMAANVPAATPSGRGLSFQV